jgi:RibD domain-containing protein
VKQSDGGAIFIHGSAELARRLSDADLIDRYNLLVFPVLLGAGKSLFSRDDRDKRQLRLRESESYSNGVTKLVYDVVHRAGSRGRALPADCGRRSAARPLLVVAALADTVEAAVVEVVGEALGDVVVPTEPAGPGRRRRRRRLGYRLCSH